MPDVLRRAGTALVLLALLLAGLFLLPPGGVALMMALIVGIGGYEWARLCGFNPHLYAGLVVGTLFALFWLAIVQPVLVQATIGMAGAILAEATMSFLGLGVPPPTASWGSMLNDGRSHLFDAPHLVLFPAGAVMLAVLSFNFIGDALRDYLDPRSRIEAGL